MAYSPANRPPRMSVSPIRQSAIDIFLLKRLSAVEEILQSFLAKRTVVAVLTVIIFRVVTQLISILTGLRGGF
ncbi:TPA: hypothetical protein DIU27_05470 [Candidatus Collierbacteria bacterium]|nr:hypothetical protein [Candidatus Collierbacteria bacterium]